jgi:hypothetical protein
MKPADYRYFYHKSRDLMARLLQANAPEAIIANEARILLSTSAGGAWKAMAQWAWRLIGIRASNAAFDLQIFWLQVRNPRMSKDEAADRIIDRMDRVEAKKQG